MKDTSMRRLTNADLVRTAPRGLDARARSDLERITGTWSAASSSDAGARRPARGRSWRAPLAVTAVTLTGLSTAVLVLGVGIPSGVPGGVPAVLAATPAAMTVLEPDVFTASGLTPGQSAGDALDVIADRTQLLPNDVGTGPYARISTESWYLSTTVDGKQVTSEVVPSRSTSWTAQDGSGRTTTQALPPDEAAAEPREDILRPASGYWPGGVTVKDLAAQLEAEHPAGNGPAERLEALRDLSFQQPLPPALRAAVLRYLGATPGLAVTAMVQDRSGRVGLAVSLDSSFGGLPNRRTVVVSTTDGRILATEEKLTKTAGALNVAIPSVISYTTFLDARYVSAATSD